MPTRLSVFVRRDRGKHGTMRRELVMIAQEGRQMSAKMMPTSMMRLVRRTMAMMTACGTYVKQDLNNLKISF